LAKGIRLSEGKYQSFPLPIPWEREDRWMRVGNHVIMVVR